MENLGKGPQHPGSQVSPWPGWGHADDDKNCVGQVGGQVSHSREGGAAEDVHSNGAWQVAGLPATSVLEVEGVQGLEVIRVSFQAYLAQELVLQDSVVPDLGGDRGSCGAISKTRSIGLWGVLVGCQGLESPSCSASPAEQKEPCIASAPP